MGAAVDWLLPMEEYGFKVVLVVEDAAAAALEFSWTLAGPTAGWTGPCAGAPGRYVSIMGTDMAGCVQPSTPMRRASCSRVASPRAVSAATYSRQKRAQASSKLASSVPCGGKGGDSLRRCNKEMSGEKEKQTDNERRSTIATTPCRRRVETNLEGFDKTPVVAWLPLIF